MAMEQLKFVPAFSKIGQPEGKSCDVNVTPEAHSVVTVLDVSPDSCGPSSSTPKEGGHDTKREGEKTAEAPPERPKRGKFRAPKLEKE
ncbi:LacI family transcriptional regulator [Sesbania bispinosa]|nr:LacI family transcriptional regulator [Sesbania bispinosa]